MHHRWLPSSRTLVLLAALVGLSLSGTARVAGQAPSPAGSAGETAAAPYTPPRTPDGRPDLQGFWTNSSYTPLERPDDVNEAFYTLEEVLAREASAAERESGQTEPGTRADVHYDFSQFGLDRSQSTIARNLRTSLIVDPPDGRIPPMTAEGRQRAADRAAERAARGGPYDAVQNMPAGSRCIIMGGAGPPMMNAGYNSNYQIVQSPDHVMILTEMIHDVRIIPIDGRPQPPAGVQQWIGLSRGRWDGDTLVVETTNFNGKNPFRGSSERMRVTERFTRVADDTIRYQFTVDDPHTWTRPWTADMPMQRTIGPIFEFSCHETNYGIANILAGARADERKAAEETSR